MKKYKIIIISLIGIILIISAILFLTKRNNYEKLDIIEIKYTYGGGFGTIVETTGKTITFTPDGKVLLSNEYNSYTETLTIKEEQYKELSEYINERMNVFEGKLKEQEAYDGGSSYIEIKTKDNKTYKNGGYMISDKSFNEIEKKIDEIIDYNVLKKYEKNIQE